jgi:hypothetical protein
MSQGKSDMGQLRCNIQEISFDCNAVPVEKKIEGTVLKLIPAKFTFKNGTSNDRLIRYFHKSVDDYNFALTGEVKSGGSALSELKIRVGHRIIYLHNYKLKSVYPKIKL